MKTLITLLLCFVSSLALASEPRIERGVIWDSVNHLEADIYRPQSLGLHPGILLIHGGGWTTGSRTELDWFGRGLADAGFVAVSIDYRLLKRQVTNPQEQYADVKNALNSMILHAVSLSIDPTQIGVLGGSAGGHLAAMLATEPNTPLKAAVILWGPTDLTISSSQLTKQGALVLNEYRDAAGTPTAVKNLSPIFRITPTICKKWLLIHGEKDELVPVVQSRLMRQSLVLANIDANYMELSGQRHFPQDPAKQQQAAKAMLEFFNKSLANSKRKI